MHLSPTDALELARNALLLRDRILKDLASQSGRATPVIPVLTAETTVNHDSVHNLVLLTLVSANGLDASFLLKPDVARGTAAALNKRADMLSHQSSGSRH